MQAIIKSELWGKVSHWAINADGLSIGQQINGHGDTVVNIVPDGAEWDAIKAEDEIWINREEPCKQ